MKVAVGSDHAGFTLKQEVAESLRKEGYDVVDVGTNSTAPVDYPDYAEKVALAVKDGRAERAVLICGSGVGACVAANKVPGIRAADAWNRDVARLSREHNDANVLCLGARFLSEEEALGIIDVWVSTGFDGGRHATRVAKISGLEAKGSS